MSTGLLLLCFLIQAICYSLILCYKCYDHHKNGDKKKVAKKLKLKGDILQTKRHRTPAEKIKTWMESAQFRVNPDPGIDLGFPPLQKLYFEEMQTPRLLGGPLPRIPVIAPDVEVEGTHVVNVENHNEIENTSSSSTSLPDPKPNQRDALA